MDNDQKTELVKKIEKEIGIETVFKDLGLQCVTRNGHNVYCVCPFHENADSPTGFGWNTKKGFGYCFTQCHRAYDLFDITMKAKGVSFSEAVSWLADLVGFDINFRHSKKFDGATENRAFLAQIKRAKEKKVDLTNEPFDPKILQTFVPKMHSKLREWGFDNDVRDFFDLGFCLDGYLSNRITIPIDDINGNIVTVSGRSVLPDEDIDYMNIKKYLIYYETDKAKTLYNISRALPFIELTGEVFVVEGFKSVWKLYQWGICNVVATMGSTISDEQLYILHKTNAKIIVIGDRDEAGKKLNKEVADGCKQFSEVSIMDMFMVDLPLKSSPAELTQSQFNYLYSNLKEVV